MPLGKFDFKDFPTIPVDLATPPELKVSREALTITMWTLTAFTLAFVVFRCWIRARYFGRLLSDDYMVVAAWCLLLVNIALVQDRLDDFFGFYALLKERVPPVVRLAGMLNVFMDYFVALNVLYATTIWLIKLSFMMLFYRLGIGNGRRSKVWWWVVLAVNVVCYVFSSAIFVFRCASTSSKDALVNCAASGPVRETWENLFAKAVLDVFTDLLILTMPFIILWDVKIPMRQKFGLMAVLSVSVVKMATSIVRTVSLNSRKQSLDIIWLLLFCTVEMSITIFNACIASVRQLFIIGERKSRESRTGFWHGSGDSSTGSSLFWSGLSPTVAARSLTHKFSFSDKDGAVHEEGVDEWPLPPKSVYAARQLHLSSEARYDSEAFR